jgi:hypothetical protein
LADVAKARAMPGGAPATPSTPVVTAMQAGPLAAQLTSSTGTHWSWTFQNAAGAVVGTSTVQNPLQAFPQTGDYTAIVDATDDDPMAAAPPARRRHSTCTTRRPRPLPAAGQVEARRVPVTLSEMVLSAAAVPACAGAVAPAV